MVFIDNAFCQIGDLYENVSIVLFLEAMRCWKESVSQAFTRIVWIIYAGWVLAAQPAFFAL